MSALDADAIGAALGTLAYGRSLDLRAQTRSTNDDARAAAEAGAPRGHVVVADTQSAGRGSRGRTWSSPAGVDLYLSIVERVPLPLSKIPPLTLAVGLGVADAVDALVGPGCARVKWPNDVRVGERKCAGILVETSSAGHKPGPIILGIGLGVNRTEWESELAGCGSRAAKRAPERMARSIAAWCWPRSFRTSSGAWTASWSRGPSPSSPSSSRAWPGEVSACASSASRAS